MKVRITISSSGKAQNVGRSNSIVLADAQSIDEIKDALDKEFAGFFPKYQKLDEIPVKKGKKE